MKDEFSDRHQAIKMRLAGQSVEVICQTLERSREWFHTWWRRYQSMGAAGLYDVTRARQSASLISPDMERTILMIRKRLESTYHPQTRYALIGASAIQAELKALHIRTVPCARTIERVLQRNGVTLPRVRLARFLPTHVYPAPQAPDSNHLHQVDLVGPIYLKGQKQRYYIFVCQDVFDGDKKSPPFERKAIHTQPHLVSNPPAIPPRIISRDARAQGEVIWQTRIRQTGRIFCSFGRNLFITVRAHANTSLRHEFEFVLSL